MILRTNLRKKVMGSKYCRRYCETRYLSKIFDRNIFFNKKFGRNNFFRKTRLQYFDRNTDERTVFRKTFDRKIFRNISIAKSFAIIPIAISSFTKILIAKLFANNSRKNMTMNAKKNKNKN